MSRFSLHPLLLMLICSLLNISEINANPFPATVRFGHAVIGGVVAAGLSACGGAWFMHLHESVKKLRLEQERITQDKRQAADKHTRECLNQKTLEEYRKQATRISHELSHLDYHTNLSQNAARLSVRYPLTALHDTLSGFKNTLLNVDPTLLSPEEIAERHLSLQQIRRLFTLMGTNHYKNLYEQETALKTTERHNEEFHQEKLANCRRDGQIQQELLTTARLNRENTQSNHTTLIAMQATIDRIQPTLRQLQATTGDTLTKVTDIEQKATVHRSLLDKILGRVTASQKTIANVSTQVTGISENVAAPQPSAPLPTQIVPQPAHASGNAAAVCGKCGTAKPAHSSLCPQCKETIRAEGEPALLPPAAIATKSSSGPSNPYLR